MRKRSIARFASAGLAVAALVCASVIAATPAEAGGPAVPTTVQKLVAADRAEDDRGGAGVAVSGTWAVFGAPYNGASGAAYVATRSGGGWSVVQKISVPNGSLDEEFGSSAAIHGDTIVIGAPAMGSGRGAAYVFVRSGLRWVYQGSLVAAGGTSGDEFGGSVSVYGDTIAVGATGRNSAAGRVYVFVRTGSTWAQQAELYASDQASGDRFGTSVAVWADTLLIGSPFDDSQSSDGGAAYAFTRSGTVWSQRAEILSSSSDEGERFGSAVDLMGDTALIGAPLDIEGAFSGAGSASFYDGSGATWTFRQRLVAATPAQADQFGSSVAVDGIVAVVGAQQADVYGTWSGAAYYFIRAGATYGAPIVLPPGGVTSYSNLGSSIAVSGTTVVAGAIRDSGYRGAAYVYHTPNVVVHRFFNPGAGTHFYTDSAEEALHVIATWPTLYSYEGVSYVLDPAQNPQQLYRFYKPSSSSHFYTADPAERDRVISTLGYLYTYDGPTYSVTPNAEAGKLPAYRFFNVRNGSHFYTTDEAEMMNVRNTLGYLYQYEGPAFWIGGP